MKKTLLLTTMIITCFFAFSQTSDEEAIKKVVTAETEAYYGRNLDAWRTTWQHDPKITRTIIGNNYHYYEAGWDSADVGMTRAFKASPKPEKVKIENSNYQIVQKGDMAWVQYDQKVTPTDGGIDNIYNSREYRVLVKEGNQWKIAAQMTTMPESFNMTNPRSLEDNFLYTGYTLMQTNKTEQALEVLKLNAKLFPNSWRTYEILGEVYAKSGNKKMAIENYEKSVKLNPKSTSGQAALARLKTE